MIYHRTEFAGANRHIKYGIGRKGIIVFQLLLELDEGIMVVKIATEVMEPFAKTLIRRFISSARNELQL